MLSNLTSSQRLVFLALMSMIILLVMVLASRQTPVPKKTSLPKPSIALQQKQPTAMRGLSEEDALAREQMLLKILHGRYSGVLYESSRVRVEYISSLDRFTAQILTADTEQTKHEVSTWFQEQGISPQGLCHLPLVFHLSIDAESELGEAANTFNPLPEGC